MPDHCVSYRYSAKHESVYSLLIYDYLQLWTYQIKFMVPFSSFLFFSFIFLLKKIFNLFYPCILRVLFMWLEWRADMVKFHRFFTITTYATEVGTMKEMEGAPS